ncbi:unnamed protein product [Ceutorhynchus assimilis]|uniref:Leishmanolysin-like peptidase n=1 Tax=Ceutorhynchus assimilis TaxID=467358 RepID=A0A9N9M9Y9_9CUCU|nr:unnamed protein product [Ceutorhynchus assimilis]
MSDNERVDKDTCDNSHYEETLPNENENIEIVVNNNSSESSDYQEEIKQVVTNESDSADSDLERQIYKKIYVTNSATLKYSSKTARLIAYICSEHTICGEVEVPQDHLDACRVCNSTGQNYGVLPGSQAGDGIPDFDFVFHVSAMQTERCNKSLTVAYANHCQRESGLDRPIPEHANLCPNNGPPLTERSLKTGKPHLNETLQTYQWSENVIKFYRRTWFVKDGYANRQVHMIITPNVVREARHYFNCTVLEGAELDDQGEERTALTH